MRLGGHEHKYFFLQTRTESELIDETDDTFRKIEYAYFVCNNCPDNDGKPEVIKVIVKNKESK